MNSDYIIYPAEVSELPTPSTISSDLFLLKDYLKTSNVLADTHESFRLWYTMGLAQQIHDRKITYYDSVHGLVDLRLSVVNIASPSISQDVPMYPAYAIATRTDYAARVYVTPKLYKAGLNPSAPGSEIPINNEVFDLFTFPCPVMTPGLCNLTKITPEQRSEVGYSRNDPGTYFIYQGSMMVLSNIDKLRFLQVHCLPGGVRNNTAPGARQLFLTTTGTIMVKIIKSQKNKQVLADMSAFGAKVNEADKESQYNTVNVMNIAKIIDHYYRTSDDEVDVDVSEPGGIVGLMMKYIRVYTPIPDPMIAGKELTREGAVQQIQNAFSATIYAYQATPNCSQVLMNIIQWKNLSGRSNEEIRQVIHTMVEREFFPTARDKRTKLQMLAVMIVRLLAATENIIDYTARDKYSHRKLDTYAYEFGRMVRSGMNSMMNGVQAEAKTNDRFTTTNKKKFSEMIHAIKSASVKITDEILKPFRPDKPGGSNRLGPRFETTQRLDGVNPLYIVQLTTKVHVNINSKTKSMTVRGVDQSQMSFICSAYTPDNKQCGLTKYASLGCKITPEKTNTELEILQGVIWRNWRVSMNKNKTCVNEVTVDGEIICYCEKLEDITWNTEVILYENDMMTFPVEINGKHVGYCMSPEFITQCGEVSRFPSAARPYPVMINGIPTGFCSGKETQHRLALMRRAKVRGQHPLFPVGSILPDTCIVFTVENYLELYIDGGRVLTPLAIVEDGNLLIDTYGLRGKNFTTLFNEGVIEYVDAFELEYHVIAKSSVKDLKDDIITLHKLENEIKDANDRLANITEDEVKNAKDIISQRQKLIAKIASETNKRKVENMKTEFEDFQDEIAESEQLLLNIGRDELTIRANGSRIANMNKHSITHCLLHAATIVSIGVALTPYPEYQQAVRGNYQAKFLMQALAADTMPRVPIPGWYSIFPRRPIAYSSFSSSLGLENKHSGVPANVVIMSETNNQEDAITISKEFAETAGTEYIRRYTVTESVIIGVEFFRKPKPTINRPSEIYAHLTDEGLPYPGLVLSKGQPVICKVSRRAQTMVVREENLDPDTLTIVKSNILQSEEEEDAGDREVDLSVSLQKSEEGTVVDIIPIYKTNKGNNQVLVITVVIEVTRRLVKGGKVSIQSQKMVVGSVLPSYHMPIITEGYLGLKPPRVDILVNPHSIVSRMTVGVMLEIIVSRAAALRMVNYDATIYEERPRDIVKTVKRIFNEYAGVRSDCREGNLLSRSEVKLRNGKTGELMAGEFFFGTCQLHSLHHLADEKIQGCGERDMTLKQGKRGVGARWGEQESYAGAEWGAVHLLRQRLGKHADVFTIYLCRGCGESAQTSSLITPCVYCGNTEPYVKTRMTYMLAQLKWCLAGTGVHLKLDIDTEENVLKYIQGNADRQARGGHGLDDIGDEGEEIKIIDMEGLERDETDDY